MIPVMFSSSSKLVKDGGAMVLQLERERERKRGREREREREKKVNGANEWY